MCSVGVEGRMGLFLSIWVFTLVGYEKSMNIVAMSPFGGVFG